MILEMKLDLPTESAMVPVVRRQVDALLQHMSVVEEDIYRTDVIVTEACSNVVRHAYDGCDNRYRVEIQYHVERFVLRVTDWGRGFDPDRIPRPVLGQIGGYGIYFIRETADSVQIESDPAKGTVLLAEIGLRYMSDTALRQAEALERRLHDLEGTCGP